MSEKVTVHYPEYYNQFSCIGSACENTCCASWAIAADDEALKRYRRETGSFRTRLKEGIDLRSGSFRMQDGRCPFLDEKNLCEMYQQLGKNSLCKTCREFPRHVEDYGALREISLSLSCPEAARLILSGEGNDLRMKTKAVKVLDPIEEEEFLDFLLKLRDVCFYLLDYGTTTGQEETPPMRLKLAMLLSLAGDVQNHLDRGEEWPTDLLGRYTKKGSFARFEQVLQKKLPEVKSDKEAFLRKLAIAYLRAAESLEPVSPEWRRFVKECRSWLETADVVQISSSKPFLEDEMLRALMHYFLFVWLLGSVYDGEVLTQMKLALVSCILIELVCRYLWTGKEKKQELFVSAAHLWARELEHSDENLSRMEKMLQSEAYFSLKHLMYFFKL